RYFLKPNRQRCSTPSAFCLLPSAFCLLPSAFCLPFLCPLRGLWLCFQTSIVRYRRRLGGTVLRNKTTLQVFSKGGGLCSSHFKSKRRLMSGRSCASCVCGFWRSQ